MAKDLGQDRAMLLGESGGRLMRRIGGRSGNRIARRVGGLEEDWERIRMESLREE